MQPYLRSLTFSALVAWMFVGPFLTQVLGYNISYVRSWKPYGNHHNGCVARYFAPDTPAKEISRLKVLFDADHFWEVQRPQRHILDKKSVFRDGRQMCRKLGISDLRVTTRCARWNGFETVEDGGRNLCKP